MSIVVTAATGHLGTLVIKSLLDRGVAPADVVAAGRSREKLSTLATLGVRTEMLDYDDPAENVFGAGDTVLLVSGNELGQRVRQHQNVIDRAAAAGVNRIVYTSLLRADTSKLAIASEHAATEQAIRASGLTYTFLRNGWYTENSIPTFDQAKQTGSILSSAGEGRISSAARADFAEGAAVVLTADGYDNAVYELGGDSSWTAAELAQAFSEVLGRDIALNSVDGEQHAQILTDAGVDEATAGFLVGLDQSTADGDLLVLTGDLSRLIGRPTTPFAETVRTWVE